MTDWLAAAEAERSAELAGLTLSGESVAVNPSAASCVVDAYDRHLVRWS